MGKLIIKISVLIVAHLDHSILHSKSVAKVFSHFMVMDLYDPIINILSVKKCYPLALRCFFPAIAAKDNNYNNGRNDVSVHNSEALFEPNIVYPAIITFIEIANG